MGQTTLLHSAAMRGSLDELQTFLKQGVDANTTDEHKRSPLHLAAAHGWRLCINALVAAGADPQVQDEDLNTPLHAAVANGHVSAVVALLAFGANRDAANKDGTTPMELDDDKIRPILFAQDWEPSSGLEVYLATLEGDAALLRSLLEATPPPPTDFVDAVPAPEKVLSAAHSIQKPEGRSPLRLAAYLPSLPCLKVLLKHGADPSLVTDSIETGEEESDEDEEDDEGEKDFHCRAPIHEALRGHNLECLESLKVLLAAGADPDTPTGLGLTPLHLASEGWATAVRLLVRHGAKVNVVNARHETPLYLTVGWGGSACALALIEGGADPLLTGPWCEETSSTLLHLAARRGAPLTLDALAEATESLLDRGNDNGKTPLYYAASHGRFLCAEALLERGADTDVPSKQGRTALQIALKKRWLRVSALLVSYGAALPPGFVDSLGVLPYATTLATQRIEMLRPAALAEAEARVLQSLDTLADTTDSPLFESFPEHARVRAEADAAWRLRLAASALTLGQEDLWEGELEERFLSSRTFGGMGPGLGFLESGEGAGGPPGSSLPPLIQGQRISYVASALARARAALRCAVEAEADAARRTLPLVIEAAPVLASRRCEPTLRGPGPSSDAKRRRRVALAKGGAAPQPQPPQQQQQQPPSDQAAERAVFAAAACVGRWGELRALRNAASARVRAAEGALVVATMEAEDAAAQLAQTVAAHGAAGGALPTAPAPPAPGADGDDDDGFDDIYSDAGSSFDGSEVFHEGEGGYDPMEGLFPDWGGSEEGDEFEEEDENDDEFFEDDDDDDEEAEALFHAANGWVFGGDDDWEEEGDDG